MNKLVVSADLGRHRISKHIYGHFAEHLGRCIYEGIWVGPDSPIPNTRGIRNDVAAALRELGMPNLRWPGGCFADMYHWKDGIGPREERPSIVNVHWGGVTESNHFGTHEFMDLCEMIGCEPYICGNVGSGTVQEMAEWLEYITMPGESPMAALRRENGRGEPWPLKYWAVGNENWGCGGNMRPQYYVDEYRRFACFCRNYAGGPLYKVACGHTDEWNDILVREAHPFIEGLSVHYYTVPGPWHHKGSATEFGADEWYGTLKNALEIEDFVKRSVAILDRYDQGGRIGLVVDEWGTWYDVEPGTNPGFLYQQNTLRDALVAGATLNVFNNHARRVHMANIAQTVNVLQAMVLTEGARMLRTPTYHVFEMLKVHQDATLLPSHLECGKCGPDLPQVTASASLSGDGTITVSLTNIDLERSAEIACEIRGACPTSASGRVLTAQTMNAHNTFDRPDALVPTAFDGFTLRDGTLTVELPPKSVVVVSLT